MEHFLPSLFPNQPVPQVEGRLARKSHETTSGDKHSTWILVMVGRLFVKALETVPGVHFQVFTCALRQVVGLASDRAPPTGGNKPVSYSCMIITHVL